ncbi:MAG: hypothetical protein U5K72_19700 [Balneolaceae bacterium]|nr:hypothetical protein [Balneolaceae bacterium]
MGGRGTGKSTILNLIKLKTSEEIKELYDESEIIDENGSPVQLKDAVTIEGTSSHEIEFLSQNEIEQFALNTLAFTKVVYERLKQIGDRYALKDKGSELYDFLDELNSAINRQVRKISLLQEKKRLENLRGDKNKEISILKDEDYLELQQAINGCSKELTKLKNSRKKLENMLKDIQELIQKYKLEDEVETDEFSEVIIDIISTLQKYYDDHCERIKGQSEREKELERDLKSAKDDLKDYLTDLGYEEQNISNISSAQAESNELSAEIEKIDQEINIIDERNSLVSIDDNLREEFEGLLIPRIEELNEMLKAISETTQEVEEIALSYEFDIDRAFEDFCKKFNKEQLPTFESGTSLSDKDVIALFRNIISEDFTIKSDDEILK